MIALYGQCNLSSRAKDIFSELYVRLGRSPPESVVRAMSLAYSLAGKDCKECKKEFAQKQGYDKALRLDMEDFRCNYCKIELAYAKGF